MVLGENVARVALKNPATNTVRDIQEAYVGNRLVWTNGVEYEGYPLEVSAKAKKTASAYTIFGNTNSSAKGVGEKIVKNSNGTYSYNGQTLTEQQLCTALGYSSIPSLPIGSTYHLGVIDGSRNLWDEEWESGFINQGTLVSNSDRFRSKNYNPIKGGATIYVACNENIFSYVQFYDSSKTYLSYVRGLNETLSVPATASYFKIAVYSPNVDTSSYHHNICINISDSKNGQYSPYFSAKKSALFLTAPLNKIGELVDSVDNKGKEYHALRVVDLGSLGWIYLAGAGTGNTFLAFVNDAKNANNKVLTITEGYENITATQMYGSKKAVDLVAMIEDGTKLKVHNFAYTDAAAFKTAMQGVMCVYELAAPTTATAVSVGKIGVQKGDNVITADTEVKPTKIKAKI